MKRFAIPLVAAFLTLVAMMVVFPASPRGAVAVVRQLQWPAAKQTTLDAIRSASEAYALDYDCMLQLADRESTVGRNPAAYYPGKLAQGLYQFIPDTWKWATQGHFGQSLSPDLRIDDTVSAWTAAYLMELGGERHWGSSQPSCRLRGTQRFGAAARPIYVPEDRLAYDWPADYWVRQQAYFAVMDRGEERIRAAGCNGTLTYELPACERLQAAVYAWRTEQPAVQWWLEFKQSQALRRAGGR